MSPKNRGEFSLPSVHLDKESVLSAKLLKVTWRRVRGLVCNDNQSIGSISQLASRPPPCSFNALVPSLITRPRYYQPGRGDLTAPLMSPTNYSEVDKGRALGESWAAKTD